MEGTGIVALKPEERVLLRAARLELGTRGRTELEQLLTDDLDWRSLGGKAVWHENAALLMHHLESSSLVEIVPAPVASELRVIKQEQRVRFRFFLQPELERVLARMASAGVEIIPLKGAFLMNEVYPDVSLRPVGDLDLLVREVDLPLASETLTELGYRSRSGDGSLPRQSFDDHHHFPRALSPDGSVDLELHRHVVRRRTPLYFPIERFWERSSSGEIGGNPTRVLAPRDLVTHLCLVFFLDRRRISRGYGSLRQLVDLAESLRHYEHDIDWQGMMHEYEGGFLQGPLLVSLRAARELLDAPVPPEFMQAFQPGDFDEVLFGHFLRHKVLNDGFWFFHGLVEPHDNHWWNITKAAVHRLLPPESYLENKYQRKMGSLGGRLLWQHMRDASHMAQKALRSPRPVIQEIRTDTWMNRLQL